MRTVKHDTLAEMGLRWLAARSGSFRGATELPIAPGYVADAAALCVMQHSEYFRRCKGWNAEVPSQIHYDLRGPGIPDYFSCIFEAKAFRSDFQSTFHCEKGPHLNRQTPMVHLHWIVIEPGVCQPQEVPLHWGLLVRYGRGLKELVRPKYCQLGRICVLELAERMLWKDQKASKFIFTACPNCNKPLEKSRRPAWNAHEPEHLQDADPDDLEVILDV